MTSEKPLKPLGSVLVIGGCGFLGHHIVSQLHESYSAEISVLDLRTDRNRVSSVSYYDGDITSEVDVRRVLEEARPRIVIHTASPAYVANDNKDAMYKKVNVDGTRNLIELAGEIGCVKAFVYTSSASIVHDNVSDLINVDERWPVLYSPLQTEYYSEKMIPGMMVAYEKRQTKFQLGSNDNLFDFSYVGNVAYAHILAAVALVNTEEPMDRDRVDGEAFFITNDSPLYFWDFARLVWKTAGDKTEPSQVWVIETGIGLIIASIIEWIFWLFGRKPNLTRRIVRFSSMARYYNIDKAKKAFGYQPLTGMEEAIVRSVNSFLKDEGNNEKTQ